MATCSLSTLIDDSCANGFFSLAHSNEIVARGVALQLLKDIAGDTSTIGQLMESSCGNGFMALAHQGEKYSGPVVLQLLCDISQG